MQSSYNDIKNISPFTLPFAHSGQTGLPLCLGIYFYMNDQHEIWRDVAGFEGYYMISNLGRIKSLTRKITEKTGKVNILKSRIIRQCVNDQGYWRFTANKDGKRKGLLQHRLIATAFIPNPENKPFINHKNGIRSDNRIENLEWCTHQENVDHSWRTGLNQNIGEGNSVSKLTLKDVLYIKKVYEDKWGQQSSLARMFNVTPSAIASVVKNKSWAWVEIKNN